MITYFNPFLTVFFFLEDEELNEFLEQVTDTLPIRYIYIYIDSEQGW